MVELPLVHFIIALSSSNVASGCSKLLTECCQYNGGIYSVVKMYTEGLNNLKAKPHIISEGKLLVGLVPVISPSNISLEILRS